MSADWVALGGIGLLSELGQQSRSSHINNVADRQSKVASVLRCSDAEERQAWRDVCDPDKQEEVWKRIETFKRSYPHLCVGKPEWDFVGQNRLPINYDELGRRSKQKDEIIRANREIAVGLLCRTYGKLSASAAASVARTGNYYLCWSALPCDELVFLWGCSPSEAKSIKAALTIQRERNLQSIDDTIRSAQGEQHDAIVYMVGYEFDPEDSEAVRFVTEELKRKTGISRSQPIQIPPGVSKAEPKEGCGGITYIPDAGELPRVIKDILWAQKIIESPGPSVGEELSRQKDIATSTFFDGSFGGMIMFVVLLIAIIAAVSSISSLF